MRPILTALLLLTITATCRAEYDAGPAKPLQASGPAFGDGMTATRATRPARVMTVDDLLVLGLRLFPSTPFTTNQITRVRTPRTHRSANVPTRPYGEIIISQIDDSFSIFVPAK
jgi:hypothetical protein